jgi:hypothetical protein
VGGEKLAAQGLAGAALTAFTKALVMLLLASAMPPLAATPGAGEGEKAPAGAGAGAGAGALTVVEVEGATTLVEVAGAVRPKMPARVPWGCRAFSSEACRQGGGRGEGGLQAHRDSRQQTVEVQWFGKVSSEQQGACRHPSATLLWAWC